MNQAHNPHFDAADRCDACGAQAWVSFQLPSGGKLMFCAHHARKHSAALTQQAKVIYDDRSLLKSSNQNLSLS